MPLFERISQRHRNSLIVAVIGGWLAGTSISSCLGQQASQDRSQKLQQLYLDAYAKMNEGQRYMGQDNDKAHDCYEHALKDFQSIEDLDPGSRGQLAGTVASLRRTLSRLD